MMQGSSSSQASSLSLDPAIQIQDIRLFERSHFIMALRITKEPREICQFSAPAEVAILGKHLTLFENPINDHVAAMKAYLFLKLRPEWKRGQCVVGLLFASSIYWTWRLREKLTDATPRALQETLRLWFAWALLGIAPSIVFFAFVYQSTVITPNRFVERLNRSLAHYHVAYSAETGRLLRTTKPEAEHTLRQPVRLKTQYRTRGKAS